MTNPRGDGHDLGNKSKLLYVAFLFIIAVFAACNMVALAQITRGQAANRKTYASTVARIEAVSRVARLLDQKRLLVDAHIFEGELLDMQRIEKALASNDAELAATSRAYETLGSAGDEVAWVRLQDALGSLAGPLDDVLRLSRRNQDAEARGKMASIEKRFETIAQHADKLILLSQESAAESANAIESSQRTAVGALIIVTLVSALLALITVVLVMRAVMRRDTDIEQATRLLETRNRELDAFAGRVAHDLRGPLTAITLSADRLAAFSPQGDGASNVLHRSVTRMEELIGDLLALSRIDAQAPGSTSQAASVTAAVEEDLAPAVKGAGGVLRVDVAPAALQCSDGLLREALDNLGQNAVKYRRPDVPLELEIRGRERGSRYAFSVSDNGSGMSTEVARHAFDPFFRGAPTQSAPGTGLGLSIVKRIVEASGGHISVESEPGRGTTFILELPRIA